jgi:hypothetical protein
MTPDHLAQLLFCQSAKKGFFTGHSVGSKKHFEKVFFAENVNDLKQT